MLGAIFQITKPVHAAVALLFLGVPTEVSYSRFLSLIPLRLLRDTPPPKKNTPAPLNSQEINPKNKHEYFKTPLFGQTCSTCQVGTGAQRLSERTKVAKTRHFTQNNRSFYAHFGARNRKDTTEHLLLPSTGPVMNSLPSTLRFHLTFISYANAGRRKTVTGSYVQPSSFVSLLLCQTPKRSSPLCLPTFCNEVLVNEEKSQGVSSIWEITPL